MPRLSSWFGGGVRLNEAWRVATHDHVISLAWSHDDRQLAVAGVAGAIWIVDADTGETRHTLPGHKIGSTTVTWVGEGTVASAGQDGRVRIWDVASGGERFALDAGAKWVERLAVSPCGNFLASAAGKNVRLWDREGRVLQDFPDHASTVTDLAWRPGVLELTASAYGGVTLWSPASTEPVGRFQWKGSVLRLAWSPDGKYLVTGDQDSTIHFWIPTTDTDLKMWGYKKKVMQLAWDHTSRFLATGGGHQVVVWDCSGSGPEGTRPLMLDAHAENDAVSVLAFQRRGTLLASGGSDGRVQLWRPRDGRGKLAEARFEAAVTQAAWSGDDSRLAVGTDTGELTVFRVE